MSGRPRTGRARARGGIEALRSGALRVQVYARIDAFTGKRRYLTEVVPAGHRAWDEAEGHYIAGERMRDGNPHAHETLSRQDRYQRVRDNLRVKEVKWTPRLVSGGSSATTPTRPNATPRNGRQPSHGSGPSSTGSAPLAGEPATRPAPAAAPRR